MLTKEVKTSVGTWKIRTPKSGPRNKALIDANTGGDYNPVLFFVSLLPSCILERPESFDRDVPIVQVLDDLEPPDYDKLMQGLREIMEEQEKELQQKKTNSDQPTNPPNS